MHSPFKENARCTEWMILRDSVPQRQRARVDRQIPERTPLTVTLAAAAHYPFLRAWSGFTTISCFTGGYLMFPCCWHPASPPPPLFCSFPPNLQEQITQAHVCCGTPSLPLRDGKLGPKNRSWEISSYLVLKKGFCLLSQCVTIYLLWPRLKCPTLSIFPALHIIPSNSNRISF